MQSGSKNLLSFTKHRHQRKVEQEREIKVEEQSCCRMPENCSVLNLRGSSTIFFNFSQKHNRRRCPKANSVRACVFASVSVCERGRGRERGRQSGKKQLYHNATLVALMRFRWLWLVSSCYRAKLEIRAWRPFSTFELLFPTNTFDYLNLLPGP